MEQILNAAFIGCGAIAQKKHLPISKADCHIHIKMLYDRNIRAAEYCKTEFGSKDTVIAKDVEEIFASSMIDLVFIGTPNSTHAKYAVSALESGKHVICEKPMAVSSEEAKCMLLASRKYKKMLHISYQNRYTKQARYAKRLFEEGVISDIYYAKAYALRRRALPTWGACLDQNIQGGGPLIDIGSHSIDLALWLSGCESLRYAAGMTYRQIAKRGSRANLWREWDVDEISIEDSAFGFVMMENGMTLSVETAYALNTDKELEASVDLFGADAGIVLRETEGIRLIHETGGRMCVTSDKLDETRRSLTPRGHVMTPAEAEHEDFMEWLLEGKVYDPGVEQAFMTVQIVEGIYRSAMQKEPVYFS